MSELGHLETFILHRCIKPITHGRPVLRELHHFSDASELGYGAVSYVRLTDEQGRIHCTLLMSKSRVAPLKKTTIPRLELAAATVSIRLDVMIRRELDIPIDNSWFWTDSTSVLKYIANNETRFKTFVANRLAIIHDGSRLHQWKYVPTKQNPSDCASRGMSGKTLKESKFWSSGPDFLWQSEDNWTEQPVMTSLVDDSEVKRECKSNVIDVVTSASFTDEVEKRFSSWHRLKRCVAWILRYIGTLLEACRSRKEGRKMKLTYSPFITVEEMEKAETEILRHIQSQHFSKEIEILGKPGSTVKKSSNIAKLSPILKMACCVLEEN